MKKNMINKAHVEGRVFENKLKTKVSAKGVQFIYGSLEVATDEECLNVIPVHYVYVAPTFGNGKENATYGVLKNIMESGKTVVADGKENATMVRLDPSIGVNDFYRDENGQEILVSAKRNEGGFAHIVTALNADEGKRNTFEADMVINGTVFMEGDEERGTSDKLVVKGCVFNFANKMLPVEFSVTNPNGIKYFENLDATAATPVFTKVWGRQINETIVTKTTEDSAFGESVVKETKKTRRDWVITGTSTTPYEFDDEATITAADLKEAIAAREIHLAETLQRHREYQAQKANKNNAFNATPSAPVAGDFSF